MKRNHQIPSEDKIIDPKTHENYQKVDLLDVLLDEENHDPLVFFNDQGEKLVFEQIAIVPYQGDVLHDDKDGDRLLHVLLRPLSQIDGISDDDAIVFYIYTDENGEHVMKVETDEDVAIAVYNEYRELLEESHAIDKEDLEMKRFLEQLKKKK